MKHKKLILSIVAVIILAVIGCGIYIFLTKEDKDSTLTVLEKQWIESNKNKVIDISIVNEIPVLNYNGEGIFFDFLTSLEENTGLEFNKISYTRGEEPKTEYAFKVVDQKGDNQILLYQDNYVLLTKEDRTYSKISEIDSLTVGVLNSDLEKINTYLLGADITYKTYENTVDLLADYNKKEEIDPTIPVKPETVELDAVILPKTVYLKDIISSDNLHIAYNITEYTKDYVLTLGNNDKLNDILKKYYRKWESLSYKESYNKHLSNNYFTLNNIDEKEKVKFRSKRYSYGFIENAPYDQLVDNKLVGINNSFMTNFAKLANIEISYKKYDTIEQLVKGFNENKIDFFFANNANTDYLMDITRSHSPFSEDIVVVSHITNKELVNSLNSLKNTSVMAIRDSAIAEYLASYQINLELYNNIEDLLDHLTKDRACVVDLDTYHYYVHSDFSKYKIDYQTTLKTDYTYLVRDIKDNQVFADFLSFYLSFVPEKTIINEGYVDIFTVSKAPMVIRNIAVTTVIIIVVSGTAFLLLWFNPKARKKRNHSLSKEDKLRYIDMLTSLKNRNYLNDHIDKWDDSEVYPQTIIIIDLNNIAYINDNYGHAEGDKVIKEASNILIKNQIANSDMIRTNGNEFLIYLVGYDEKQVVSYMRKLNKEFKELAHGFGAAMGYSMIHDAIKTIDDAVNEATLDMRNNKEELNN